MLVAVMCFVPVDFGAVTELRMVLHLEKVFRDRGYK